MTIKFLIDHHSTTSITPHIDPLGFIPSASSPDRLARLFPLGSDGGMIMAITSYLSLSLFLWFPQFPVLVNGLAFLRPRNRNLPTEKGLPNPKGSPSPYNLSLSVSPFPRRNLISIFVSCWTNIGRGSRLLIYCSNKLVLHLKIAARKSERCFFLTLRGEGPPSLPRT
jgi:hypothetical protein